jgi:hypothetical protein
MAIILSPCKVLAGAEWSFTPSMTVEGEHSDNFFRAEDNKVNAWVIQYAPGFALEALTDKSRLDLNYTAGYFEHFGRQTNGQSLSTEDYLGHNLMFYAASKVSTRVLGGIQEEYLLTREPGSTDNFNNQVTRDKYYRNRVTPFVTYDIAEKGELKCAYRNEQLDYIDAPTRPNSVENRGIVTATYNMNNTNHIDIEEQVFRREYTAGLATNYDSYQTQLIYRRELSSWLAAQAGAGYQYRAFDNNVAAPDFGRPVYSIGVTGATAQTKMNLSFEHGIVDFTLDDSYFDAYRVNAFIQRLFLEDRLRAYGGGYWQLSDYIVGSREDDTYNIYGGLGYSFCNKLLELSVEYNFTNRSSNTAGNNYAENIIYMRLSAKYDIPKKNPEGAPK